MGKIGSAVIDFEAKDKGGSVSKAFTGINKGFKSMDKAVNGFNGKMKSADKSVSMFSTSMKTLVVSLGGLLILKKASAQIANFEQRMVDVSTLLRGDATKSIKIFEDGIKDLLGEVPKSADDLGASAYAIVSAGITDAAKALEILDASAKLAVAGLGSTEEATTLMVLASNNFRDSTLTAEEKANVLFKTVQAGITTVAELSQSFGQVAPLAVEAGISFEELQAATGALTQVNKSASISQNQIKASLISLGKPTKDAIKLFEKLGVKTFAELIESSGGYVNALQELKTASGANTQAFNKAIGSGEALSGVNALLGSQNEAFTAGLSDMTSGVDVLSEAFRKQQTSVKNIWQLIKNDLTVAVLDLGAAVLPTVKVLLNLAGSILGRLIPALKILVPILGVVGVAFAAYKTYGFVLVFWKALTLAVLQTSVTLGTGGFLTVITNVIAKLGAMGIAAGSSAGIMAVLNGAFITLTTSARAFGAALLANPIGLVIAAIAVSVVALVAAYKLLSSAADEYYDVVREGIDVDRQAALAHEQAAKVMTGVDKERFELSGQLAEANANRTAALLALEEAENKKVGLAIGTIHQGVAKEKHDLEIQRLKDAKETADKEFETLASLAKDKREEWSDYEGFVKVTSQEISDSITENNEDEVRNRIKLLKEAGVTDQRIQLAVLKFRGKVNAAAVQSAIRAFNSQGAAAAQFKQKLVTLFSKPIFQQIKITTAATGIGATASVFKKVSEQFSQLNISSALAEIQGGLEDLEGMGDPFENVGGPGGGGGGGADAAKELSDEFKKQFDNIEKSIEDMQKSVTDNINEVTDSYRSGLIKISGVDEKFVKDRAKIFKKGNDALVEEGLNDESIASIAGKFQNFMEEVDTAILGSLSDAFDKNISNISGLIKTLETSDFAVKDLFDFPSIDELVSTDDWNQFWKDYSDGIEGVQKRLSDLIKEQAKVFADIREDSAKTLESLGKLDISGGEKIAKAIFDQEKKLANLQEQLEQADDPERASKIQEDISEIESILRSHNDVRGGLAAQLAEIERREELDPIAKIREDFEKEKAILEERIKINSAFFEDSELQKPKALADVISELKTLREGIKTEEGQEHIDDLIKDQENRAAELEQAKLFLEQANTQKESIELQYQTFLEAQRVEETANYQAHLIEQQKLLADHASAQIKQYEAIAAAANKAGQGGVPSSASIGFKSGGYTGAGSKNSVAGLVHRNEYVIPSKMVNKLRPTGFLNTLEGMRRGLKGFADGGMTSGKLQPVVAGGDKNIVVNFNNTTRANANTGLSGTELMYKLRPFL